MDRSLYPDRGSAQKRIADIWLMFTAGTSGAIPTTLDYAEFISSVVLSGTGIITVNLQDVYIDALEIDGSVEQASLSASTASRVTPAAATDVGDATTPKVVVQLLKADGTAANMAIGDVFRLHIALVH